MLTDEHWNVLQPLMPPQPRTGRRREHDREVFNSLVFRLKTGCRYRDLPRTPKYAAPSTTHYWLKRWTAAGLFKHLWRRLLGVLKAKGELNLTSGSLDGSFVPAKRGATGSPG